MGCGQPQVALNPAQTIDFGAVKLFYRGNGSAQIRGRGGMEMAHSAFPTSGACFAGPDPTFVEDS